ncbi:MAG: helix-turn-helix transcriptional regulator [Pseudomonadota bacterium]
MQSLIQRAIQVLALQPQAPFSVYSAAHEQLLSNVPLLKPMMIVVAAGCKQLDGPPEQSLRAGQFVLLPGNGAVNMRNIPLQQQYQALLIEFEGDDFDGLPDALPGIADGQPSSAPQNQAGDGIEHVVVNDLVAKNVVAGDVDALLHQCLLQFIDWSARAPESLWPQRRRELLQLLHYQGWRQLARLRPASRLTERLQQLIRQAPAQEHTASSLAAQLAMSEATLHRRLRAEKTRLQDIKDQVRLGLALHWLQSSDDAIQRIGERCGYFSASRFSEKFRQQFGMSPRELRRTRLME